MKAYKIKNIKAYSADEQGIVFGFNEPTNTSDYYSEYEEIEVEIPNGYELREFNGVKRLYKGNNEADLFVENGHWFILVGYENYIKLY